LSAGPVFVTSAGPSFPPIAVVSCDWPCAFVRYLRRICVLFDGAVFVTSASSSSPTTAAGFFVCFRASPSMMPSRARR
jgi:hypothetical protein